MGRTAARWTPGTKIRILLVDGDLGVLSTLRDMLKSHGHAVFIAVDADAAVLLARQHAPHVICAGMELEGSSGYELARQLRALPQTTHSLMIALAHSSDESDVVRQTEAGFDDFLLKPLNFDDILHMLNHAINV